MAIVKVRNDGNSLVVTIPCEEARRARIQAGTPVEIKVDDETGELHIQALAPRTRPDFVRLGTQVIREKKALLDRLADDTSELVGWRFMAQTLTVTFRRRRGPYERRPTQTVSWPIVRDRNGERWVRGGSK